MSEGAEARPTIAAMDNGPYVVTSLKALTNSKGETLEVREKTALCRCGGSSNKPYCDGTHASIGFSSERTREGPPTSEQAAYEGDGITVLDNRSVCSHAAFCTDELPSVWRMKEKPWIVPTAAENEEVISLVRKCPSGALGFIVDNVDHTDEERDPAIFVSRNGPYAVVGCPELTDSNGQTPQAGGHYTLCRCGLSTNKPFCDGSHGHGRFVDEGN